MKNKIYIIDWHNFIYRIFYAVPKFTLKDGTPINAVFGLTKMIISWYEQDKPDNLIFVLDSKWKNFREEFYPEYKWTRDRMPDDLRIQEKLILEMLNTFKITPISQEWYEADDIIWTLVKTLKKDQNNDIYILSWDKDLYQFIDTNVSIYDTMKRKIFHKKEAIEKFVVSPEFIVDYLAICWDSSDNIPWIPWFWPKKAEELINKFWNLEEIYNHINELSLKTKEILVQNKERAFLSKKLATIYVSVDLKNFELSNYLFSKKELINKNVIELFKKFEFKSLIPEKYIWEIKNFSNLWFKINEIESENELKNLIDRIVKNKRIWFSSYGKWDFQLDWISIFLWEKEVYNINSSKVYLKDFLEKILNLDLEIIWFDLKEDLKKVWWYLEKNKDEQNILWQTSLF